MRDTEGEGKREGEMREREGGWEVRERERWGRERNERERERWEIKGEKEWEGEREREGGKRHFTYCHFPTSYANIFPSFSPSVFLSLSMFISRWRYLFSGDTHEYRYKKICKRNP